jgi:hypothetical protein
MSRYLIPSLLGAILLVLPATALADGRAYEPQCESRAVLNHIKNRFSWAERRTWHRGFVIDEIRSPRLRYQILYGPSSIRHDHCAARAVMSDGSVRHLYYAIDRRMGFASIGNYIRFCIVGLDPWRIYGAACSTVR